MKKIYIISLVLISTLIISACYVSEVPLSKPTTEVDQRLIKNWVSTSKNKNDVSILLLFRKFNENEYLIIWKDGEDKPEITRGFISNVNGTKFINVQYIDSIDKKDRTYVFFKYDLDDKGNLVINILSDDYPNLTGKKFKTSKDFYKFIQKNISKNGLFGESIEFKVIENINFEINP